MFKDLTGQKFGLLTAISPVRWKIPEKLIMNVGIKNKPLRRLTYRGYVEKGNHDIHN